MPWFCGSSKKRHSKSKVGNASHSRDASVISNGRPSFTVILQDFTATIADELSTHRGQVLEALYTHGEWIYVRNIDGKCGYIPQSFCYPLDSVSEKAFQKTTDYASLHRPRPVSLHLDIAPVSQSSQSSVGINHTQESVDGLVVSTPVMPRASLATPESTLSHTSSPQRPVAQAASVATPESTLSSTSSHRPVLHKALSLAASEHAHTLSPNPKRAVMRRATVAIIDGTASQTSSPNPQRISLALQGASLSETAQAPTPSPRPQTRTHRRSLSSGNQRVFTGGEISIEPPLTFNSQPSGVVSPIPEGAVPTPSTSGSRMLKRRQSLPATRDMSTRSDSFQYTPYSARPHAVKRSVSMNDGAHGPRRMRRQAAPINRNSSYQEAVLSTNERWNTAGHSSNERMNHSFDEALSTAQRHSSIESPRCTRRDCDCTTRPKPNARRKLSRQFAMDYGSSSDDVFLPNRPTDEKKPFGIFCCLQDFEPTFKGEVALKKNDLVIVLDYGRGEWAWIITSHHVEGLVPKKRLARYNSDRGIHGVKQTDVSTQTELVVSGAVRNIASSASNGIDTVRQTSSASKASVVSNTARQVSSASSASGGNSTPLDSAQTATTQTDWFSFTDSLERPPRTPVERPARTRSTPTERPPPLTPVPSERAPGAPSTPVANRRLPMSAPVTPNTPTNTRQLQRLNTTTDRGKSFSSKALNSLSQRGKPALCAVKDYAPAANSKNCLTLKKGDVLTPQTHMHYPKGWMWVWHAEQRRFGYVPNHSVVYTYPVARNHLRTATTEDAV